MPISRREWMLASMCWSELLAIKVAPAAASFAVLNHAEAIEVKALCSVILPQTETPGAEQAGAVHFIDAALAGYDRDQVSLYRQGLLDIATLARQISSTGRFSELSPVQQTQLMKSIEETEFFAKLRTHTILAYFGNPQFGWKLIGREDAMHFDPPFGFYDAEERAR